MKNLFLFIVALFLFEMGNAQSQTLEPVMEGPKEVTFGDETIYNMAQVEVKPEFPGGMQKFFQYVGRSFNMPDDESFTGGKILVNFIVEKDGSISEIKVLKDIGFGTANEAIRVLKSCPKWMPAEHNGKKIRCNYLIPIMLHVPIAEKEEK
ncbi:energy transducer TonB [Flavobacterium sp.]|uniref:energy transducer TonB n=1 Tax=Flavobacterium sp. TaxID=239 RepID=UPI003750D105